MTHEAAALELTERAELIRELRDQLKTSNRLLADCLEDVGIGRRNRIRKVRSQNIEIINDARYVVEEMAD